jgi:membrane protein
VDRLRERYEWIDRLIRAGLRYVDRNGDYYAAAITYYSVLALVPLLMIGFAATGFVLAGNPGLLAELRSSITTTVPNAQLDGLLDFVVAQAMRSAGAVGAIGLLVALYSGLHWVTVLREALSLQWTREPATVPIPKRMLLDLLALLGLGVAIAISFGITILGGGLGRFLIDNSTLRDPVVIAVAMGIVTAVLSVIANSLLLLWVLVRLPRRSVTLRCALPGAVAAAVGFEILKQVGMLYINVVTSSPVGTAFGPILGLLVFAYFTSRLVLFAAAWTALGQEHREPASAPPQRVGAQTTPRQRGALGRAVSMLGVGFLLGWSPRNRR